MGRFLKLAVMAGVPFGLALGLIFALTIAEPVAGFVAGLFSGLLFGLLIAAFAQWQKSQFTSQNLVLEGETLIKQGAANHFRGLESVGGWLVLTDKRLLFRSHRFNVQSHELSIPLAEIVSAETCATAWIIPNGLRVTTANGPQRFVVENRQSWVDEIQRAKTIHVGGSRSPA